MCHMIFSVTSGLSNQESCNNMSSRRNELDDLALRPLNAAKHDGQCPLSPLAGTVRYPKGSEASWSDECCSTGRRTWRKLGSQSSRIEGRVQI